MTWPCWKHCSQKDNYTVIQAGCSPLTPPESPPAATGTLPVWSPSDCRATLWTEAASKHGWSCSALWSRRTPLHPSINKWCLELLERVMQPLRRLCCVLCNWWTRTEIGVHGRRPGSDAGVHINLSLTQRWADSKDSPYSSVTLFISLLYIHQCEDQRNHSRFPVICLLIHPSVLNQDHEGLLGLFPGLVTRCWRQFQRTDPYLSMYHVPH